MKKFSVFGLLITIVVLSCSKESKIFESNDEMALNFRDKGNIDLKTIDTRLLYGQNENDFARMRFSKALAKSLNSVNVRNFLKSEVISQELKGYDTEVMYLQIKDKEVEKGISFSQVLSSFDEQSESSSFDFFNQIIPDVDPYLTILVYMNFNFDINDWNTQNEIPQIGVWYSSYNNPEIIPLINDLGLISADYATNEPDKVIVGVKDSETHLIIDLDDEIVRKGPPLKEILGGEFCDELKKIILSSIKSLDLISNKNEVIISINDLYKLYLKTCVTPDGPPKPVDPREDPCERDLKTTKDIIFSYKLNGKDAWNHCHEFWCEGRKIEVKNFTTFGEVISDGLISTKTFINPDVQRPKEDYFRVDRGLFGWRTLYNFDINVNWGLLHWQPALHGIICESRWIEVDESATTNKFEFTFGWKPGKDGGVPSAELKYTLTYDPKDDILGVTYPEYCDKANRPGYEYNLGSIALFNQGHMD